MADTYLTLKGKTTGNNIFPNVRGQNIPDNAITANKIASSAVTSAKIANYSIDAYKIASNAVITLKIADGAVTTDKLDSQAVTTSKIASNAVTSGKLDNGAVTTTKIADDAVNRTKLSLPYLFLMDQDITTLAKFHAWLQSAFLGGAHALYYDETELTFIECVYLGTSNEVTIYCAHPLQGINSTITLTTDAEFSTFASGTAGTAFTLVGGAW